jgi:hypothetical protein
MRMSEHKKGQMMMGRRQDMDTEREKENATRENGVREKEKEKVRRVREEREELCLILIDFTSQSMEASSWVRRYIASSLKRERSHWVG